MPGGNIPACRGYHGFKPNQPPVESYEVQQARKLAQLADLERNTKTTDFFTGFWQVVAVRMVVLVLAWAGLAAWLISSGTTHRR